MASLKDYVNATELVSFVRAVMEQLADEFPLNEFLPNTNVQTNRWSSTDAGNGAVETATARAWDTSPLSIGTDPVLQRSGELVPIGAQALISEQDLVTLAELGASGNSAIADRAFARAVQVVRSVLQRVELGKGEALAYGLVRFQENGVNAVADFGANPISAPAQFPMAAIPWNDPAAKAFTDVLAWSAAFADLAGEQAGALLLSTQATSAFCRNPEVISVTTGGTTAALAPIAAVNATLSMYGAPEIRTISKRVRLNGGSVPVLPAERAVLTPATPSGETLWGITAHATALVESGDLTRDVMGGMVAVAHQMIEPPSKLIVGAAAVMPVISRPGAVFSAQVLPS